jgi:hypothetical protein
MMTDPNAQLTLLRAQRDAATDPALRAALDAAIAALEDTAPPPPVTQHADGSFIAQADHGSTAMVTVYLVGQRTKTAEQLLAGYLQRQVQRWSDLPLQGIREQKSAYDTIAISL